MLFHSIVLLIESIVRNFVTFISENGTVCVYSAFIDFHRSLLDLSLSELYYICETNIRGMRLKVLTTCSCGGCAKGDNFVYNRNFVSSSPTNTDARKSYILSREAKWFLMSYCWYKSF